MRKAIRNMHSDRKVPPRFCDVIIDGDRIYLEKKINKKSYEKILWDDVVYQVEEAIKLNNNHIS